MIIIGGGIIGLTIGFELQKRGVDVTIYDRGRAGQEATWAAAGMLAPSAGADPFSQLMITGRSLWPSLIAEIEEISGIDVQYQTTGNITLGLAADVAGMKSQFEAQQALGWPVEWLNRNEARALEPQASPEIEAGCFNPYWHHVNNRLLGDALRIVFQKVGGTLVENRPVHTLLHKHNQVHGIQTESATIHADTVILAAGAWSGQLNGIPSACQPKMVPVKGEMIRVASPADRPLLGQMVSRPAGTLVPHGDGTVAIGATKLAGQFSKQVAAGTVAALVEDASRYIPAVAQAPFVSAWAGIRPGTVDGLPFIGPTPLNGFYLATGHYTDGLVCAPSTAHLLADCFTSHATVDALQPFLIDRLGD